MELTGGVVLHTRIFRNIQLLAEVGLVGLSFYIYWLYTIFCYFS